MKIQYIYAMVFVLVLSSLESIAQPTNGNGDITASGCTITFPDKYDDQVDWSFLSGISGFSCPSGDVILADLNDKNAASTITFDSDLTLNSLTLNYLSGNNPLEIIIPSGVTLNITTDLDLNLTSNPQDKFLTVEGALVVGDNIDFDGIDLEIDGTGTISASTVTGADATTCSTSSGGTATCPTITVTTTDGCDPPTSDFCTDPALPIELGVFTASVDNHSVVLDWTTLTEINNDFFTIEKSSDGINYEYLATVAGAGNSESLLKYTYKDRSPAYGRSYYRLKQTDYDGTTVVSGITKAEFSSLEGDRLAFSQNPADMGSTISVNVVADASEQLYIMIFDMKGRIVKFDSFKGANYDYTLNGVNSGVYFVKVSSVNRQQSGRLIVR